MPMNPITRIDRALRVRSLDIMVREGILSRMAKWDFFDDDEVREHVLAGDISVSVNSLVPDYIFDASAEGKIELYYDPLEDRSSYFELDGKGIAFGDDGNVYMTETLGNAELMREKTSGIAQSLSLPRKPVVYVPADKAVRLRQMIEGRESPESIVTYLKG